MEDLLPEFGYGADHVVSMTTPTGRCRGILVDSNILLDVAAVRWNIKVSKDTDLTLRTCLGAQGMKKGDVSKFIDEAVRRRVLQCTIQDIRARNANADPRDPAHRRRSPQRGPRNVAPK